jgi:hypothetical protein
MPMFGLLRERLTARLAGLQGVDVVTTARLLLKEFVRFAAACPELHRFMLQEGTGPSERLEWLVAKHVSPMGALLQEMLRGIESAGGPSPDYRAMSATFSLAQFPLRTPSLPRYA